MRALEISQRLHRAVADFADASLVGSWDVEFTRRRFQDLAIEIASFQAEYCEGHARRWRGQPTPASLTDLRPLPVDAFRFGEVFTFERNFAEAVFRTSGTTASLTGRHYMRTTDTYRMVACSWADRALRGAGEAPLVLALLPRPNRPVSSSLATMVNWLMERWSTPATINPWFLGDEGVEADRLRDAVATARTQGRRVVLFSTSFALVMLLDALGRERLPLSPGSTVVYTGGFKGRTREVPADQLRARIEELLGPERIVGEFGMTELSSQLYEGSSSGAALESAVANAPRGTYLAPPWLSVRALDPTTLEPVEPGQPGLAGFIDLANVDSAVYVVTQDLIREEGGGVRLLGRMPRAPMRGCSLAAEAIWSAQLDNALKGDQAIGRGSRPPAAHPGVSEPLQGERLERVRRLVEGARRLADPEDELGIAVRESLRSTTGLSPAGIEAGLRDSLETQPSGSELQALCASVAAAPRVWVLLSANVFVAAHRAIACALAASPEVYVRPSRREPAFATALHAATGDLFRLVDELAPAPGDHVHAYGSDETLAELEQHLSPGVELWGHGSGFGAVAVYQADDLDALARGIALDTILFEQRGCASPRLIALASEVNTQSFASALRRQLERLAREVPPADLPSAEIADLRWFREVASFVAEAQRSSGPAGVFFQHDPALPLIPPGARNLVVFTCTDPASALHAFGSSLTCVAVAGGPEHFEAVERVLPRVRVCQPGRMQRPPFDGPLDLRTRRGAIEEDGVPQH